MATFFFLTDPIKPSTVEQGELSPAKACINMDAIASIDFYEIKNDLKAMAIITLTNGDTYKMVGESKVNLLKVYLT